MVNKGHTGINSKLMARYWGRTERKMCVVCLESKVTTGSGEGCSTAWQRERGTSGRIIKDSLAEKKISLALEKSVVLVVL